MKGPQAARWALASAIPAAFLLASPRFASFYFLPKFAAVALAACAAWAALALGRSPSPRRTAVDGAIAALLACCAWSLLWSTDTPPGILGSYPLHAYGLASLALYAALYFAAASSAEEPDALLRATLAAGSLLALYGLLQKAGIEAAQGLPAELPGGRITSLQGNPVFLGSCLVLVVPVALSFLTRRGFDRVLGGVALGSSLLALLFTVSRAAWLGAAAAAIVTQLASGRWALGARRAWLLGGAGALALSLIPAVAGLRATQESDSGRAQLWRATLQVAAERPWAGVGPDAFQTGIARHAGEGFLKTHGRLHTQSSAHNDLLQAVATLGIPGLLAYLWLLWTLLARGRAALAQPERREVASALLGALAGLFVQAKFNPAPLSALAVAAIFAGLLAPFEPVPLSSGKRREPELPGRSALQRLAAGAAALACALIFGGAVRLSMADACQTRAARAEASGRVDTALREYERSTRLNPWEPFYWRSRAQALFTLANRSEDPATKQRLMTQAAELGKEAAARRPGAATGWHIRGTALAMLRIHGGPDRLEEAEQTLDRALELDWSAPGTLENRLRVARLRGDQQRGMEVQARLARLKELVQTAAP